MRKCTIPIHVRTYTYNYSYLSVLTNFNLDATFDTEEFTKTPIFVSKWSSTPTRKLMQEADV